MNEEIINFVNDYPNMKTYFIIIPNYSDKLLILLQKLEIGEYPTQLPEPDLKYQTDYYFSILGYSSKIKSMGYRDPVNRDVTIFAYDYQTYLQITNIKHLPVLIDWLKIIYPIIYPGIPYTKRSIDKVYDLFYTMTNSNIDKYPFPQPKELDLFTFKNGILTNSKYGYIIAPKADGLRKMLFTSELGAYLVIRNSKAIKLSSASFPRAILEGEYLEDRFLIFDVIFFKGKAGDYLERMKKLYFIFKDIKLNNLKLEKKDFEIIYLKPNADSHTNFANFYKIVDQFVSKKFNYPIDGYIFTPIRAGYNLLSKNYKDCLIYKWKPPGNLTIDFIWDQGLYTSKGLFQASEFDPINSVDYSSFEGIPQGSIVEVYPDFSGTNPILKYLKIRSDKIKPNPERIAIQIWNVIKKPLDLETLTGHSFTLVRMYHNSIKKELLSKIPSGSYLLDIGSGKGGDLKKWDRFSKVLGIEPNQEFAQEFVRRLNVIKPSAEVVLVIEKCCEDLELLLSRAEIFFDLNQNSPNLYISMMLSLSFFWKDEMMLNQLVNFMKSLAKWYYSKTEKMIQFLFLTVMGEEMKELFDIFGDDITLGQAHLQRNGDEIFISITKSIVIDQVEYFVNLEQLMELSGFELISLHKADQGDYLSEEERLFSSLYSYGKAVATIKSLE